MKPTHYWPGIYGQDSSLMKPADALLWEVEHLSICDQDGLVAFIKPAKEMPLVVEHFSIHDQDSILVVFIKPAKTLP